MRVAAIGGSPARVDASGLQLGSGLLKTGYSLLLLRGYRHGDFSLVYPLARGTGPLLVSVPHAGTAIPDALRTAFVPRALATEDADWHLEKLYAFVRERGASLIVPRFARYVIDLNRPLDNEEGVRLEGLLQALL